MLKSVSKQNLHANTVAVCAKGESVYLKVLVLSLGLKR